MTTPPSNSAGTHTEQPAAQAAAHPAHEPEMDLAGTVDQLLADIDAAGKSLTQDMAADAPAPTPDLAPNFAPDLAPAASIVDPAPASSPASATEAPPTPAISASNADLLAQVEALIEQANAGTIPPPSTDSMIAEAVAAAQPEATPTEPVAAPVAIAEPVSAPVAQPTTQPASKAPTRSAEQSPSLKALDEEVSRLADEMLDKSQPAHALPQPSTPAPQFAATSATTATSAPSRDPFPEPIAAVRSAPFAGVASAITNKLGSLFVAVLAPISAPLAKKSPAVRQSIGWVACGSIFFATVLWAVVLTRTPPETQHASGTFDFEHGTPPALPVAHADPHASADAHAKPDAGHGEASGDHGGGHDAKPDAKKAKPTAKKPPRKNKAASQAKKDPPPSGHH